MAILSGFKSFERYLKVPSDNGNGYQLASERTLSKDIIFDDGKNLNNKVDKINDDGKNLNNKVDKINTELSKINTELSKINTELSKINTELSKINTELSQALYIVSFDASTGTLTTKSADYVG